MSFGRIGEEHWKGDEIMGFGNAKGFGLVYEISEEVEDADGFDPIKYVVRHCESQVLNMNLNLSCFDR